MRALYAAAVSALTLTVAGAAFAQNTPTVTVAVGPELQAKTSRIGARDVDELRADERVVDGGRCGGDGQRHGHRGRFAA